MTEKEILDKLMDLYLKDQIVQKERKPLLIELAKIRGLTESQAVCLPLPGDGAAVFYAQPKQS